MKKHLHTIKKTALLIVGIGVVVAASYVMATGVWNPAPANPPSGNTETLINTDVANQVKQQGDLAVGNNGTGVFAAYQNAAFAGDVYFNGMVRGGLPTDVNSTVAMGGTDAGGTLRFVNAIITGGLNATGSTIATIQANTLMQASTAAICADQNGVIAPCGANVSVGSSSATTTSTNPNTNYNHIPPVRISIYSQQNVGGTTGLNEIYASLSSTSLDNISVYANVTLDPSAPKSELLNPSCFVPETVSFYIPAGSTVSTYDLMPSCHGAILDITVTNYGPTTTSDNRQVLPPTGFTTAPSSGTANSTVIHGKGGTATPDPTPI